MKQDTSEPARSRRDLAAALRMARAEDAERSEVLADLRTLQIERLSLLRDALDPVLAQVPAEVDLFDIGLMPGDPPRLFIDMIAFVEMSRDRRYYRFYQDRRHGRILLAEAETLDDAADAVTAYMARRLVERDKALASDLSGPALGSPARPTEETTRPRGREGDPEPSKRWRWLAQSFWFVVETIGLLVLFGLAILGLRHLLTIVQLPRF